MILSICKAAWAPSRQVKESYKDDWDVELGVAYIPWGRLPHDLTELSDGAVVDEESLPPHLKSMYFETLRYEL